MQHGFRRSSRWRPKWCEANTEANERSEMCSAIHVLNNYHNNNSNKNWIRCEDEACTRKGVARGKSFGRKNLHELIVCVRIVCCCRSISLAKCLLLCFTLLCVAWIFVCVCVCFCHCCCCCSSSSSSSMLLVLLAWSPITSPLVSLSVCLYITILCIAPLFLRHHACTWTCNDKFYWKVSLTRIFISSSSLRSQLPTTYLSHIMRIEWDEAARVFSNRHFKKNHHCTRAASGDRHTFLHILFSSIRRRHKIWAHRTTSWRRWKKNTFKLRKKSVFKMK